MVKKILSIKFKFLILAFVSFVFTSCDPFDCIVPRGPELPKKKDFYTGANREFRFEIEAEVKNQPNDDHYDYYFTLEGNYPSTLKYRREGVRTLVVYGTIPQAGTYEFIATVSVDNIYEYYDDEDDGGLIQEDGDDLCFYEKSEIYKIIVEKNYVEN
ncbi:hypothetical protein [Aureivirga sp. CE67]|uniref:hypothetical protein n=1 Tax=Aureivirga sp. CE67 TaxID=1788983 RepID=UPI0018C92588|nr:hypothetical protein [Aureivirga sp. CE67]